KASSRGTGKRPGTARQGGGRGYSLFLKMGSQNARAVFRLAAPVLGAACANAVPPRISSISLRGDAPDLSLRGVAFARLSEGRVVARGNAERLDYRRAGATREAVRGRAVIHPDPGSRAAAFGSVRFVA